MPELRDEWNLKATTINDSVKNQLESTGLHAPWMGTEWRVFLFRYYSLTVSSSTYWRPHNSLLAHSQITLIWRFSSKRETARSLPTPCCVSIILKHLIKSLQPSQSPGPESTASHPHGERCVNAEPVHVIRKTTQNRITSIFFQALFWGICRRASAETEVHFYYCSVLPSRTRSGITP